MELLTPGIGLIFWQVVVFALLFVLLLKFAWKPIIGALQAREQFIEQSLEDAKTAQEKLQHTQQDNKKLIEETHRERDRLLKEAQEIAQRIQLQAKEDTQKIADKMLADAKKAITAEEQAAMERLKKLVVELSMQISEKILRKQLAEDATAISLIEKYVKELPRLQ